MPQPPGFVGYPQPPTLPNFPNAPTAPFTYPVSVYTYTAQHCFFCIYSVKLLPQHYIIPQN